MTNKNISIFGGCDLNPQPGGEPFGPGKVVYNLLLGLKKLNIKHNYQQQKEGDYNILVNGDSSIFHKIKPSVKTSFIGPCVESRFGETGQYNNYKHFIAASDWHKRFLKECSPEISYGKTFDSWPIGIDTDFYKPKEKKIKYDCLLHLKHQRVFDEWGIFEDIVKKFKLKTPRDKTKHLVNGQYTPKQMKKRCASCKFIVTIGCSETQGIGKMEMMANNVPMFVLDSNVHFAFNAVQSNFPATTVPYWSEECGIVLHEKDFTKDYAPAKKPSCDPSNIRNKSHYPRLGRNLNKDFIYEQFSLFLNNLNLYNPRDYILKEHTVEKSVINLINIFEKNQ